MHAQHTPKHNPGTLQSNVPATASNCQDSNLTLLKISAVQQHAISAFRPA
jgi:hypothetical protein